jgi:3-hydroxy-9,10-secoandrosta-1,3,5(10)-triene-9,17-dione monooxygenase
LSPNVVKPEVTPEEIVARADAMRPRLLEEQAATEDRSFYSEATHEAFREAGFYSILVPRRYGGLELDVATFYKVVMSISRGCPSTGWMLCLGAGHALQMATCWPEQAQEEIFGRAGYFVAPASFSFENALAEPVDGGFRVRGTWHFCSGAPYGSHHLGLSPTTGGDRRDVASMVVVAVPRDQFRMLDNWGDLIGLKGSGSHSITVEETVIPAHHVISLPQFLSAGGGPTPGYELHGNPMYGGEFLAFASGELNSVQVGNAQGAVDEYERLMSTRNTLSITGPGSPRKEDQDYQRCLGLGIAYTDAAYSILVRTGELYHEYARLAMEEGEPFSEEKSVRIYGQHMTAHKLCWEAGDTVFRAASTSGARDGARMQRYWRDLCAFRTNGIHQLDFRAHAIAQARLGLPVDLFERP